MNVQDFMKFQLLTTTPNTKSLLSNIIALTLVDKAIINFSVWFPYLKSLCSRPHKHITSPNKQIRATIECERIIIPSNNSKQNITASHVRMDSVIHYITTIPEIKNLLCMTHHDYLPNEFEAIQIEPDLYFQLLMLKHSDGQVECIKFRLFCYEHEIQYLQQFIDKCNIDYERRMANKLGTSLYYFDIKYFHFFTKDTV